MCFCAAEGSGVESIHNTVCRTTEILANRSCVSQVGRALGDSRSKSEGLHLKVWSSSQTSMSAVIDADQEELLLTLN